MSNKKTIYEELEHKCDLVEGLNCYDKPEYIMQEIAMISLMLSSGSSVWDICNLRYIDFVSSVVEYFPDNEIPQFEEVYSYLRQRDDIIGKWYKQSTITNSTYVTFCTAESIHAILDWFYIKNEENFCVYDYLFTGTNGKRITREEIAAIFRQMRNNSGINIRPYDVRKLFVKTLKSSAVPDEYIQHFLGQSFDDARTEYLCQSAEFLKGYYMKAVPHLSLNQSGKTIGHEDYLYWLDRVKYDDWLID